MIPRRPPVPSRVYDCLAGGYHCDEADIMLADRLAGIYPGVRRLVASNRAYLACAALLASSSWAGRGRCREQDPAGCRRSAR